MNSDFRFQIFPVELETNIKIRQIRPHLSDPGPLQLPLAVGLLVVQGERFPTGGRRRSQAGAVTHREAQGDKDPRSRLTVQEGRGQPVVFHTGVLVDVTHLKGPDELPPVVQDADLIPLKDTQTKMSGSDKTRYLWAS